MKHVLIYLGVAIMGCFPTLKADASPPCYRQIQTTFFRQDLLATGLSLYQVQQNTWYSIYTDLSAYAFQVPNIVQNLARSKTPNPLEPVFDPNVAIEILRQALFQVFQTVMWHYKSMSNFNINQNTINGVFSYLWQQQLNQIQACILSGVRR